ncbi:hypothetical protein NEOLEDRAFT_308418 [Neolentinus lepideus HHB14362 ss-1]|uniref:Uncharacterized protein n=1 Tax=Neolentinus lepideus HHB14362 ss-1 TaxID=1314782 RepID=A0A165VS01_9AGAM|nr:hypothetical protein NEOLEDRAFT_308418 [Neolentinus lepideus HHB14362 ss-1]
MAQQHFKHFLVTCSGGVNENEFPASKNRSDTIDHQINLDIGQTSPSLCDGTPALAKVRAIKSDQLSGISQPQTLKLPFVTHYPYLHEIAIIIAISMKTQVRPTTFFWRTTQRCSITGSSRALNPGLIGDVVTDIPIMCCLFLSNPMEVPNNAVYSGINKDSASALVSLDKFGIESLEYCG